MRTQYWIGLASVAVLALLISVVWLFKTAQPPPFGAFKLEDGRVFTIAAGERGARLIGAHDGFVRELESCGAHRFCAHNGRDPGRPIVLTLAFQDQTGQWQPANAPAQSFQTLPLVVRRFSVTAEDGVKLSALMVLPEGAGPFPLLALAHGSGQESATRIWHHPWQFASAGIATVIYDKRGTGDSGGTFTADFHRLARDLNAVLDAAKQQAGIDASKLALMGSSQGGWVAPLAASSRKDLRAVVVNYGLAVSPLEEERAEALLPFANADPVTRAAAASLVDAAMAIRANHFIGDWDRYKTLCDQYQSAPWRAQLENETVNLFCVHPVDVIQNLGPERTTPGLDLNYDPLPVLRTIQVPMLWTIADQDQEAPPEQTREILNRLRKEEGKHITIQVFAQTDHGMVTFKTATDGKRLITGFHPDFVGAQVRFLRTAFALPEQAWPTGPAPDLPNASQ